MKWIGGVVIAGLALVASPASAQFGGLRNMLPMGGMSAPARNVDGFLERAEQAELLTRISADAIYGAVESEADAAAVAAARKANAAIVDPREREAAERKLDAEVTATLATVDWDAQQQRMQANMDAERNHHLGVAIFNFMLAVLKDEELVATGKSMLGSIGANPMQAVALVGKLGALKDATWALASQMGNLSHIATGIPKLMTVAKVDQLPASASEAPRSASD
jgi:hypothetical protein